MIYQRVGDAALTIGRRLGRPSLGEGGPSSGWGIPLGAGARYFRYLGKLDEAQTDASVWTAEAYLS